MNDQDTLILFLSIVEITTGALIFTVSLLSLKRKLPSNQWAGIRTRTTRSSDEAWYAAHDAAAKWWLIAALASIVGGVSGLAIKSLTALSIFITIFTISILVGAIQGQRAALKVKKQG